MSMHLILGVILSSFMFLGCDRMPQFPSEEIKAEHVFDISPDGKMYCYRLEIVSLDPYRVGNQKEVALSECSGLVGFRLEERIIFGNWLEDTQAFWKRYERRKK